MLRYFAAALIVATGFCAGGVNRQQQGPDRKPASEAERYAAYSAVLTAMFVRESNKLLVIEDHTGDDLYGKEVHWDYIKKELDQLSQATIDDFEAENAKSATLENKFNLTTEVKLVSKAEIDKFFGKGGGWWEAFYKTYPKSPGLISFSNVGFNGDVTQAVLYVGHTCGGLCGTGGYLLLTKVKGAWQIQKGVMTWIS
jgi:hypothetical protein